jgi:cytochrome c553
MSTTRRIKVEIWISLFVNIRYAAYYQFSRVNGANLLRISILFIQAVLISSLFILVTAHSQEDMVNIENEVFGKRKRPPAVFKHDEHNELTQIEECNECHHIYEDGKRLEDESSEDQRCADCHELEDNGNIPGLMRAFHTNCKNCHREKKKGPIMCGQCHVRRAPQQD